MANLAEIREIHRRKGYVQPGRRSTHYTEWYVSVFMQGYRAFEAACPSMGPLRMARFLGVSRQTVRRLRTGVCPAWPTVTKCLLAGVVSHIDGAPNLALAAELEAWAAADPRPDRVCDRGKWGVGERLKAYRGMHGWSQAEAARRYGTTQCVWSAWELGARLPAPQNLARLVKHGAIDRQLAVAVLEGSGYHPNLPQAKLAHRGILPDVCDITHTPPPDPGPKKRAKKREPNPATRPNGMGD